MTPDSRPTGWVLVDREGVALRPAKLYTSFSRADDGARRRQDRGGYARVEPLWSRADWARQTSTTEG